MIVKDLTIIFINDRCDQLFSRALLSATIAQEIIVFDQQTDNDWPNLEKQLKKINPQLNFRLILRNKPIINFASVRNKVIKMVNTPWLMFLDSDEILSETNLKSLPNLLAEKKVSAYRLQRVDYFHDHELRFGETGNYQPVRLFRSNAINYQRPVHELPIIDGEVANSELIIKHYPHQNLTEFFKSITTYAQLETNYRFAQKIKVSKTRIIAQSLTLPLGKFIFNYYLKLGLLDGFAGLCYAILMSFHSLFVRIYLYEKYFLN